MEMLSIGEMAEINNISVQALRMYCNMGLIEPAYTNPETGYRYYDIRQSAVLDMIQYMKSLGLSLEEIKTQMDELSIDVILETLEDRLVKIQEQIAQLKISKIAIKKLIRQLEVYQSIAEPGVVVEEQLPVRTIHSFTAGIDFHAEGPESFESLLRQIKKHMLESKLPLTYFCQFGAITKREDILDRRLITSKSFIIADSYSAKYLPTETIPGGRYLCVYFEGFKNEAMYVDRLLEVARVRGLHICGDYICDTVAEFPVFRRAERNTFIKIQLPVSDA